jgi:putative secretion ATPase (PEP-CTERM system associated)
MYERFYQLRERPFALSPDPEYLYPSRVHQEALSYLRYGLETHAGFVVITGEIGSGKTTLLQTLLRTLDNQTTVGRIVNTILEPRELLETIMIDFGLEANGRSKPTMLRDLAQYLVDQRLAGRLVLLVIDEAQNLTQAALEELRMLSNLETEKSKLMQIVLVGQPNLRDKLSAPELEQLRQRITVSYHLPPLDAEETWHYINHRLRRAAIGAPLEFPRDATDLVHGRSRGVPRLINVICDAALVFGYAEERRQVDRLLIQDVLMELESTGVLPRAEAVSASVAVPVAMPAAASAATPAATMTAPPPPMAAPVSTPVPEPALTAAAAGPAGRLLDARQWPSANPRSTVEEAARSIALDNREQALRQRETELAEQRRVLAEEYRLLRAHRSSAPPTAPVASTASETRPRPPAPGIQARFSPARNEGLWGRVKRVMLGDSQPVVEKN